MTLEALRQELFNKLDLVEMTQFSRGFQRALDSIEELSDQAHNKGNTSAAEVLRSAAKELRGEDEKS